MAVLNYFRFVLLVVLVIAVATGFALTGLGYAEYVPDDPYRGPAVILNSVFFGAVFSPLFSGGPVLVGGFLTLIADRLPPRRFRQWSLAMGALAAGATMAILYFNRLTPEFNRFTMKSVVFYGAIIMPALFAWVKFSQKYLRGGSYEI